MRDERERVIAIAQQDYEAAQLDQFERTRIQASLADRALQALLLTNGGALIALFTFVGNVGKRGKLDQGYLKTAFAFFAIGLALALVAHILAFLSQDRFFNQAALERWRHQRIMASGEFEPTGADELACFSAGQVFYYWGLALAVFSIMAFVVGCWSALLGVSV